MPCPGDPVTNSVTNVYNAVALQSITVSNATNIDATDWAAVKTTGTNTDYVTVTANVCPNVPEATNVITMTGVPVGTNIFERQVPMWEIGMTPIIVTGCTNTNVVNVWIVWGTWTEFNNTGPKDSDGTCRSGNVWCYQLLAS